MTIHPIYHYRGRDFFPSEAAIQRMADRIGCDIAAIKAVIEVEASGEWYKPNGSFVRRFEPHHLPAHLQKAVGFSGNWRDSLRLTARRRAEMFLKSHAMDAEAACKAASWGAFQIMGFNAHRSGFSGAVAMVQAFEEDIQAQLDAFTNFVFTINADGDIRAHNWTAFARKYNGSGQPHVYAAKIERAYTKHNSGKGTSVLLRLGSRGNSVVELQRALFSRGYSVAVDGHFGPQTDEAVRRFQQDNSLPVDGLVGARTWDALKNVPHLPKPEPEKDRTEDLLDKASKVSAAGSGFTGFAALIVGENPSDTVRLSLIGVIGLFAFTAFVLWQVRSIHRDRRT